MSTEQRSILNSELKSFIMPLDLSSNQAIKKFTDNSMDEADVFVSINSKKETLKIKSINTMNRQSSRNRAPSKNTKPNI